MEVEVVEEGAGQITLELRGKDKLRKGMNLPKGQQVEEVIQARLARKYRDKHVSVVRTQTSKNGLVRLPEKLTNNSNKVNKRVVERAVQWVEWLEKVAIANPEGYNYHDRARHLDQAYLRASITVNWVALWYLEV